MGEACGSSDDELSSICREFERVSSLCQRTCAEVEARTQPAAAQLCQIIRSTNYSQQQLPPTALIHRSPEGIPISLATTPLSIDSQTLCYTTENSSDYIPLSGVSLGRRSSQDGSSTPDSDGPPPPYRPNPIFAANSPVHCSTPIRVPLAVVSADGVDQLAGKPADDGDWDRHRIQKRHTPIPSRKVRRNAPVKPIRHNATAGCTSKATNLPPRPQILTPQKPVMKQDLQLQQSLTETGTTPVPPPPKREQKPAHLQPALIQQQRLLSRELIPHDATSPESLHHRKPPVCELTSAPYSQDEPPPRPPPRSMTSPPGHQGTLQGPRHDPLEQLIRQHEQERDSLRQQLATMQENSLQAQRNLQNQLESMQHQSEQIQIESEKLLANVHNQLVQEREQHNNNTHQLQQDISIVKEQLEHEQQQHEHAELQLQEAHRKIQQLQQTLTECQQQLEQARSRYQAEAASADALRTQYAQASTMAAGELDRLQAKLQQRDAQLAELTRHRGATETPPRPSVAPAPAVQSPHSGALHQADNPTETVHRTVASTKTTESVVATISAIQPSVTPVRQQHDATSVRQVQPDCATIQASQTLPAGVQLLDIEQQNATRGIPTDYNRSQTMIAGFLQGVAKRSRSSNSIGMKTTRGLNTHQKSLEFESTNKTNLLRMTGSGCKQKTSRVKQIISKMFNTSSRIKRASYTLTGAPIHKTQSEAGLAGLAKTDADASDWLTRRDMLAQGDSSALDHMQAARAASLQNLLSSMSTLSYSTNRTHHGDDRDVYEDVTTDSEWAATDDDADAPYYINMHFNAECFTQKR